MTSRQDNLYARAELILGGSKNGFGLPILRHLALRQFGPAMLSLAAWDTQSGTRAEAGPISDVTSPLGRMRRAWRKGERLAAQNLAMTYFNIGDIAAYRHWLRRAATAGDKCVIRDVATFSTRFPHELARRHRRLRPLRPDER